MKDGDSGNASNYHLEFAQRDFLGIIDEPMEFSAATIAAAIQEIVEESEDFSHRLFLKAIVRALTNRDDVWKLTLSKRKRGRFVPVDEHDKIFGRKYGIALWIRAEEERGIKRESAVHSAMAQFNVSRQTVFAAIKEIDEFEQVVASLKSARKK